MSDVDINITEEALEFDITGTGPKGDEGEINPDNYDAKASLVDNDKVTGFDSEASDNPVTWLFSVIKSSLKTYFDTIYQAAGTYLTPSSTNTLTNKTFGDNLDMGSNKIVNVTDPTSNQDASTKKYVDDKASLFAIKNVKDYGAVCDNSTDDTAAIQSALNERGYIYIPDDTVITGTLRIYSDTVFIIAEGKTIRMPDNNATIPMLKNDAVDNFNRTVTGSATAGTKTVTSSTANFTSADEGRSISLQRAGKEQGYQGGSLLLDNPDNPDLYARIVTVVSSTEITIDTTVTDSVTDQQLIIYNKDKNITFIGGTWDKGNNEHHTHFLRRIETLDHKQTRFISAGATAGGEYAVSVADVKDVRCKETYFETYSDGYHIIGPADDITLKDLWGFCGDDFISLTTRDWPDAGRDDNEVYGDMNNLIIKNIRGGSLTGVIRIEGAETTIIDNVHIENIYPAKDSGGIIFSDSDFFLGATVDNVVVKNVGGNIVSTARIPNLFQIEVLTGGRMELDNPFGLNVVGGDAGTSWEDITVKNYRKESSGTLFGNSGNVSIDKVVMEDCTITYSDDNQGVVFNSNNQVGELHLTRCKQICENPNSFGGKFVLLGNGDNIDKLVIDGCKVEALNNGHIEVFTISGTIGELVLRNSKFDFLAGNDSKMFVIGGTSPGIDLFRFDNIEVVDCLRFINFPSSMADGTAYISNSIIDPNGRALGDIGNNLTLFLTNTEFLGATNQAVYLNSGGSLIIRGSGITMPNASTGVVRQASEVVKCTNPDFPLDISIVTPENGSVCYNTNAALGTGAGKVISDGTNWKSLFSGNIYTP